MTEARLQACPACERHVRLTEPACPFCGGALSDAFRGTQAPVPLTVRLSRAARFALGTGTLSLAAACGGATTGLPPGSDGGGSIDSGGDAAPDTGLSNNCCPPYGGPGILEDAGPPPVDASSTTHDDGDVGIAPPYGVPPPGGDPQ